jgi:hypothetical protein
MKWKVKKLQVAEQCDRCLGESVVGDYRQGFWVCDPCIFDEAQALILMDIQRVSQWLTDADLPFEIVEV